MKNECSIIRDLLPLYAEKMTGADTGDFVEEHLKTCAACRKEYEKIQAPQPAAEAVGAAPLKRLRQKWKLQRIQAGAMAALFAIALLVSAFAALDAPVYFPYSEELAELEALDDRGLLLTFEEAVTDFRCQITEDPDSDHFVCSIEAWTSLWDKWFSRNSGRLSVTIPARNRPMFVVYLPNDGRESVCLAEYKPDAETPMEKTADYADTISLPRLSLGYYLLLAAAALAVLSLLWLLTRKKPRFRIWVERIGLYPIAYVLSHCLVTGIRWSTYSLGRDFSLILFLSILLYGGGLLAHRVWYQKKENRVTASAKKPA